jgi:hypothetical protein
MEGTKVMNYFLLLCLGGFLNYLNFKNKTEHLSNEEMPYKSSGNAAAFFGGALIYGSGMCLLYWMFS